MFQADLVSAPYLPDSDSDDKATRDKNGHFTKWHWIIFIVVPIAVFIKGSAIHGFGAFASYFKTNTDESLAGIDFLPAVTAAVTLASVPILVPLIKRKLRHYCQWLSAVCFLFMAGACMSSSFVVNPPLLILTYSILYGIGSGTNLSITAVILSEYFPVAHKHHILATSMFEAGFALSAAAFTPFTAYLLSVMSWQNTIRIIGGYVFVLGILTSLFMKPNSEYVDEFTCLIAPKSSKHFKSKDSENDDIKNNAIQDDKDDKKLESDTADMAVNKSTSRKSLIPVIAPVFGVTWNDIKNRPQIWTWLISKYGTLTSLLVLRVNLVFFVDEGTETLVNSSFVMITFSVGEVAACIFCMCIAMQLRKKLLFFNMLADAGMIVVCACWAFFPTSYYLKLAYGFFLGFFIQCAMFYSYPTSQEVLKMDLAISWSFTCIAYAMGVLSSPLYGGLTYDLTKSVPTVFAGQTGLWGVQLIALIITHIILVKCPQKEWSDKS